MTNKTARRLRIQDSARPIFTKNGYERTKISDIAAATGLSVGAIYLEFKTKEALYLSLLDEPLAQLDEQLQSVTLLRPAWQIATSWAAKQNNAEVFLSAVRHDPTAAAPIEKHFSRCVEAETRAGNYRNVNCEMVIDATVLAYLGILQGISNKAIEARIQGAAAMLIALITTGMASMPVALVHPALHCHDPKA